MLPMASRLDRMEIVAPAPRGLRGVVVTDTEIGDVRGEEGFFHYRQYSAIELAATRPFDDVWQLLVDGALPGDVAEAEGGRGALAVAGVTPTWLPALPRLRQAHEPIEPRDDLGTAANLLWML